MKQQTLIQAIQFIERVWYLEKMKEAEAISQDLHRKRDRIVQALDRLNELDPRLYNGINYALLMDGLKAQSLGTWIQNSQN